MSKTVLILDGDPYAWRAAVKAEKCTDWGDGIHTAYTDIEAAVASARSLIDSLAAKFKAQVVFCWSDPNGYFRNDLGDYKTERKLSIRPLALTAIKEELAAHYESYMKPRLEGDDIIGILMTEPNFKKGYRKIAVSIDKDLKTIPGEYLNPDKDDKPTYISPEEATLNFLSQVIGGDVTDGFTGAKGFSPASALKLLKDRKKVELYEHTLTRGPRKGETETRKREVPCGDLWEIVLSCFESCGLGPEVALFNARMARILWAEDWNNDKKEVILWTPIKLNALTF